jgi:hypothetical protein
MSRPLRCYVLRAEDGGLFCGAHLYDTRAEAEQALADHEPGLGKLRVVELVEVVRCDECRESADRGGTCPFSGRNWYCADGKRGRTRR